MRGKKRKQKDMCSLCSSIPQHKYVETLHTSERLPEQVDQLFVIGGYGHSGSGQVRKCPDCGTYYLYLHDHDSEAGVGYGYTDEAIERLTPQKALDLIEKTIGTSNKAVAYWRKQCDEGNTHHAPLILKKHQEELKQLLCEQEALQTKLDRS